MVLFVGSEGAGQNLHAQAPALFPWQSLQASRHQGRPNQLAPAGGGVRTFGEEQGRRCKPAGKSAARHKSALLPGDQSSPPLSQSLPRPPAISAMYKVLVATGDVLLAGTYSSISITLIGARGESPKQRLDHLGRDFIRGAVDEYEVSCEQDLGPLLMVRLHKDPYLYFPSDNWFCRFVRVKTPQDETYHFPSYQWMEGYGTLTLREGTAKLLGDDSGSPLLLQHREEELRKRQECYGWTEYAPGWPRCLNVGSTEELNSNSKYLFTMTTVFAMRTAKS
ncbi:Hydroperoxide isomerase ALOXE3 [Varanus komodoensis]|nr:Hydroperoxide isomerase ALOXE3 [Varanus komodoensis]